MCEDDPLSEEFATSSSDTILNDNSISAFLSLH